MSKADRPRGKTGDRLLQRKDRREWKGAGSDSRNRTVSTAGLRWDGLAEWARIGSVSGGAAAVSETGGCTYSTEIRANLLSIARFFLSTILLLWTTGYLLSSIQRHARGLSRSGASPGWEERVPNLSNNGDGTAQVTSDSLRCQERTREGLDPTKVAGLIHRVCNRRERRGTGRLGKVPGLGRGHQAPGATRVQRG